MAGKNRMSFAWGTPWVVLSLFVGLPLAVAQPQAGGASTTALVAAQSFAQRISRAEAGDARAQYDVARSYQTGRDGVLDEVKAVFWLQKAADQGLMEAETSLGSAYDTGMGVPISNQKAVYWWQRAARHGSIFALRCLGYSYIEGRGVAPSNLYAYVIWRQLPSDDVEAAGVLEALRRNLSAEEQAKGDTMTLDDVFGTGVSAKDQAAAKPAEY